MKNVYPFPYYVGIRTLEEIAPADARVCVMNILGNESKSVTPVSHTYSNGNVVAGVQYGRPGFLETPAGEIPVYSRLAEVVEHHRFDTGVIYLPPEAVFYAVTELCHYNKELKRIVIITEKISVKDQRLIRAVCQANKVDVFGANCLGVADSWNRVRIGGALGGDRPEETLVKGSVAIHSNSGNFSTTIAEYLKTEGFGTSTIVSSGKDVIIQFALPEFICAVKNDPRTKAAVLYVEPGGYYEKQALDLLTDGSIEMDKPLIACVTGRWKSNLTRACGHAGALAGEGDDAISKEKWFDDYFGVPPFDPEHPEKVGKKGVRVVSIQHIPAAVKAVFAKNGLQPDFESRGDLGLKPWFGDDFGLKLPLHLKIPVQKAIPPYDEEIASVNRELGASYLRRNMRNASGASRIHPATHIAELHGISVVELADYPYESNIFFSLTREHPAETNIDLVNICLNYLCRPDKYMVEAVERANKNGATPNQALMAAIAMLGDYPEFREGKEYITAMLAILSEMEINTLEKEISWEKHENLIKRYFKPGKSGKNDEIVEFIRQKIAAKPAKDAVLQLALYLADNYRQKNKSLFFISAVILHLAYPSLLKKKVSRKAVISMIDHLGIIAKLTLLSAADLSGNDLLQKIAGRSDLSLLENSFSEVAYRSIFNEAPGKTGLREFSALLALTLTNGPGTISAKGAKESVSARNNIATAYAGYLSNTGLAHGGSGYEAVEYLLDAFRGAEIADPGKPDESIDVHNIAVKAAEKFLEEKNRAKLRGKKYSRIPCINHPVFKGKRVNIDPREDYIRKQLKNEKIDNIFWDFYHHLVEELYRIGATNNVYCVNIDAVIAVISLKLMYRSLQEKRLSQKALQNIGFLIFLLGRTAGVAAEIIDHSDRGQDMDCRTPVAETKFVM